MTSSLSLKDILDANKLTGPNYVDWLRNLKIYKSFLAAMKPDARVASKSVFMLYTNLSLSFSNSNSWVLDTGCVLIYASHCMDYRKLEV